MDNPRLRETILVSRNFMLSGCWELSTLIRAEPIMLSFISLVQRVNYLPAFLNNTLTFLRTIKNVPPITGTIEMTASASFQFIRISSMDVPTITNTEEIIVTKAIETNILTESMSEVRFVRSFDGFDLSTKE